MHYKSRPAYQISTQFYNGDHAQNLVLIFDRSRIWVALVSKKTTYLNDTSTLEAPTIICVWQLGR